VKIFGFLVFAQALLAEPKKLGRTGGGGRRLVGPVERMAQVGLGDAGGAGDAGDAGTVSITGNTGDAGTAGITGITGTTGTTGTTGITGTTGTTGTTGRAKYLAAAKAYRKQINTLHAMIFVCKDPAHITRLRARIEENERLAKEQEYLAKCTNDI